MSSSTPLSTNVGPIFSSPLSGVKRDRVRFVGLRVQRTPSGYFRAEVEMEWGEAGAGRLVGTTVGLTSPQGELRIAATAALNALEQLVQGAATFELLGIRALRAFDANLVIAAVRVRQGDVATRLVGCSLVDDQPARSAVLAVLNATNRKLGDSIALE
jgi:hypothetical protein